MILGLLAAAVIAAPDFSWMVGTWSETKDGTTTREMWMPPLDGAMSGVTQTNAGGKLVSIEVASITSEPAGVTFTARPQGQPPTAFVLKPGKAGEAVFENLAHDFPQRVIYRRCGPDLCARIEGTINGKAQGMDWRYRRLKP
jgi:hypothetical protein